MMSWRLERDWPDGSVSLIQLVRLYVFKKGESCQNRVKLLTTQAEVCLVSVSESVSNRRECLAFAHRVFSILVTRLNDEVMPVLSILVLVDEISNVWMVGPPPSNRVLD